MTNNDILRRLRYAFDINDSSMITLFNLAGLEVTRAQISDWLKKEDDPAYINCKDVELATFLNGFINHKRGKKDGDQPQAEKKLTNNLIFRKLRIALNLKDDAIIKILSKVGYSLSKHELSAFFRNSEHRQYRECKDQILRNFLHGLQVTHRPDTTPKKPILKQKVTPAKTTQPQKNEKTAFQWKQD